MFSKFWPRLVVGLALAVIASATACSSSPKPSSNPSAPATSTEFSPLPRATPSPEPSPIPCVRTQVCFHHGTVQVNVSGATTTSYSAPLDDAQSVVTATLATLIYRDTNGRGATVGAYATKPGTFPQGLVKVELPKPAGYFGLCPVTFDHLSASGADGSFNCVNLGPLFGGSSTGLVAVTGTFSASP